MKKTVLVYGGIGLVLVGAIAVGTVLTRQSAPSGTDVITTTGNVTTPSPSPQPPSHPVVNQQSWAVILHQPNGHGGWIKKKVNVKATDSTTMAQQTVDQLLHPLPGAETIFPTGTTAKVRIWDGTLEIHFSDQMTNMAPAATEQEEADRIGMFTNTLVGSTQEYEDVQFYVGSKPVDHLFGTHFDTSQPLVQEPYVGVVGKR